jgi:hypothetical protein
MMSVEMHFLVIQSVVSRHQIPAKVHFLSMQQHVLMDHYPLAIPFPTWASESVMLLSLVIGHVTQTTLFPEISVLLLDDHQEDLRQVADELQEPEEIVVVELPS